MSNTQIDQFMKMSYAWQALMGIKIWLNIKNTVIYSWNCIVQLEKDATNAFNT